MHFTLQRNIIWIAYTPLESLQIQEAGHRFVLHVLFVVTMHAVCLILKRYVCLQVLSRVLEDARHVPSDLAVKSFVSTS